MFAIVFFLWLILHSLCLYIVRYNHFMLSYDASVELTRETQWNTCYENCAKLWCLFVVQVCIDICPPEGSHPQTFRRYATTLQAATSDTVYQKQYSMIFTFFSLYCVYFYSCCSKELVPRMKWGSFYYKWITLLQVDLLRSTNCCWKVNHAH